MMGWSDGRPKQVVDLNDGREKLVDLKKETSEELIARAERLNQALGA